jgi:hypothetical protein
MPKHAAVNGEKDTAYKCVILAHPDNSVELVIDIKFASAYDNGHNIKRYPLVEIPTPHGRLIDGDALFDPMEEALYAGFGCDPTGIAAKVICEVPTIIEAEAE